MRSSYITFLLIFALSIQINAQGIEFFHGDWDSAIEAAKNQEKIIFVDAYTTWCGPCKRMAKNVFTLPEVGAFFNENFISLKIDMETTEGRAFGRKYPVSAYPTFYFIDESGKTVLNAKGGRSPEQFIGLGKSALGKIDRSAQFVKEYEDGNRDPEFMTKYVRALNKSGKSSLKIANDYIRSQKDMTTTGNLKFILEATTQADSRIFNLLIKHRSQIETLTSKETVSSKIENACHATLQTAIEFQSKDLHNEAKEKMKKNVPGKGEAFGYEADMKYYRATNKPDDYLKACNAYAKKVAKKDHKLLSFLGEEMATTFIDNDKVNSASEKYAKKAAEISGLFKYHFAYANMLRKHGKREEAKKAAELALKAAEGSKKNEEKARNLIHLLNNTPSKRVK